MPSSHHSYITVIIYTLTFLSLAFSWSSMHQEAGVYNGKTFLPALETILLELGLSYFIGLGTQGSVEQTLC